MREEVIDTVLHASRITSSFDSPVAHAHTKRHRELLDLHEPRSAEHLDHLLAADERVDGFGEVFVRAGLVAADEGRGAGEDFAEVEVVQAAKDRVGGEREFENDDASAGA